jgi:cytochrome c551/c552
MKSLKLPISAALSLLGMCSALAFAAPLSITLPAETVTLRSSNLPGFILATQKCGICHSADYMEYQPPGMTEAQWAGVTRKMRDAYGAPLNDQEIEVIAHYLSQAYAGPSQPVAPASGTTTAQPPRDVQTLLNTKGCLGCHGVASWIVGPGFQEVAARYADHPQAVQTLATSIGKGGSGKWGALSMPAFAGLTQEEQEVLAEFVLEQ